MTHKRFANVFLSVQLMLIAGMIFLLPGCSANAAMPFVSVEQVRAAGFTNASYVMGGMSAWASRGRPMVKPQ